jgi:hypothetical protein
MKDYKHIFILIFAAVLLLSNCKKYPEGGFLRQGPKTLITGKQPVWQLKLYQVNDIDSTYLIPGIDSIPDYYSYFMTFSKEKCISEKCYYAGIPLFFYKVSFSNKNRNITFFNESGAKACYYKNNPNICARNILCPEQSNTEWKIIKLRDKECILKCELYNSYKVILIRN